MAKLTLSDWLAWSSRSRLPAFVKLVRSIRRHIEAIHHVLGHRLSNARLECADTKLRLLTRIALGFHSHTPLIALAVLRLGGSARRCRRARDEGLRSARGGGGGGTGGRARDRDSSKAPSHGLASSSRSTFVRALQTGGTSLSPTLSVEPEKGYARRFGAPIPTSNGFVGTREPHVQPRPTPRREGPATVG